MPQSVSSTKPGDRRGAVATVALVVVALLGLSLVDAPSASAATAGKISPSTVPLDAGVVIAGEGLAGTSRVVFLGEPGAEDDAEAEHFIVVDAKKLSVQIPPTAVSGPVAVTTPTGEVTTPGAVRIVPPPAIGSVSARSGAPGEEITITGQHLTGSKKPTVAFGAKNGTLVTATADAVTVKVPAGLRGGAVTLKVLTDGGVAEAAFSIAPLVKAVSPKAGTTLGGTVITVTGSGFTGVDDVTIGGESVTDLIVLGDAELVARTPAGVDGAAPVVVTAGDGDVTATSPPGPVFDYQPLPEITSVEPGFNLVAAQGAPEPVVVTGRNLTAATAVAVGSVTVSDVDVDPAAGTLTFTPPAAVKPVATKLTVTNTNEAAKAFTASAPFAFAATPTVVKVLPTSGPDGTPVALTGTSFTPDSVVRFGAAVADCLPASFALLRCTAPAGTGAADVTVTNVAGSSAVTAATQFTYAAGDPPAPAPAPAPSVTSLLPAYGTPGSAIGLKGTHLHLVDGVEFTGTDTSWVDAPRHLVVGPGRIVVAVPAGAASGPLRLTAPGGRTITVPHFTAASRPHIASIDVVGDATFGAAAGDLLTIKGNGLMAGTVRPVVTVGGKVAALLARPVPNARTIVVRVPNSVGGREPVVVTTPLGSATAEARLYYVPNVKAVKPVTSSRAGGVVVTISGSGFRGVDAVISGGRLSAVTFGGVAVERLVVVSDKEIVAVTAAGAASADPVLVRSEHGAWTGSSDDRVQTSSTPAPQVTAVTPDVATIGAAPSPVTVTGTNLRAGATVRFGFTDATVQSVAPDGTSMVVLPPALTTTGTVPVTVTTEVLGEALSATLPGAFSYLPVPAISGVAPATGATGSTPAAVTVTGANLRPTTVVRFAGAAATVQSAAANGTSLTVVPPVRNDEGSVDVSVTNVMDGGELLTDTLPAGYAYSLAPATITSKSVSTAPSGATVTITGTSFSGVSAVSFGGIAAAFTVLDSSTISATVPPTPAGGQNTVTDVSVVNGTGQPSTAAPVTADEWTWGGHPIVTSVTPRNGPQGTQITITGNGFTGATAVRFGATNAASFTVLSDTSVRAFVPVTPATGTVSDVVVVARGLTSPEPAVATANDWTWTPIAVITSMTPNPGFAGSTITVNGRNFTGIRTVTVNGTDVTGSVNVVSGTRLTFVAPSRPSGGAGNRTDKPVLVTNGSGAASTSETDPATGKPAHLFTWF